MLSEEIKMIEAGDSTLQEKPFPHFILRRIFPRVESFAILDWLESSAPWSLVETNFYEQYEFDVRDAVLPPSLSFLTKDDFVYQIKRWFENLFETTLSTRIDVTAHKLLAGQTIRLHNDFVAGQETHRLLIQLNREWKDENGGLLLFFKGSGSGAVEKVIRPVHNSAVGFEISPKSNHAVTTIHSGERYTVVYSFYDACS